MNVYIGNFGSGNWAWRECLERHAIAVMDDMRVHPYWQRGDKDGYIKSAMQVLHTRKGQPPTRNTASYWYNVTTILHETSGDLWLHRDQDRLWWTVSTGEKPEMLVIDAPDMLPLKVKTAVYYKRCQLWSQHDKMGQPLLWENIHPKACDFLSSEGKGTFQQLRGDNPAYALALIEGADLSHWHKLPEWQTKAERSGKAAVWNLSQEAILLMLMRETAARMVNTAQQTATESGQEVVSVTKDKQFLFPSSAAAQEYALDLMKKQEGRCALTGLKLLLDNESGDDQCRYSLDRIDSSRHYEPGNLQVVCKFVNQWKGAMENEEFKRLVAKIRE